MSREGRPLLVTVCTGNICRSPAAEILLADLLGEDIDVASAGTHALVGSSVPPEMRDELERDGLDGTAHRGRLLTPQVVNEASALIAMTSAHRQHVVQLEPRGLRKSFTLAELATAASTGAALEGETLPDRIAALPGAIAAHRPVLAAADLVDIPDPFRRGRDAYHESYVLIREAVDQIATWLRA